MTRSVLEGKSEVPDTKRICADRPCSQEPLTNIAHIRVDIARKNVELELVERL